MPFYCDPSLEKASLAFTAGCSVLPCLPGQLLSEEGTKCLHLLLRIVPCSAFSSVSFVSCEGQVATATLWLQPLQQTPPPSSDHDLCTWEPAHAYDGCSIQRVRGCRVQLSCWLPTGKVEGKVTGHSVKSPPPSSVHPKPRHARATSRLTLLPASLLASNSRAYSFLLTFLLMSIVGWWQEVAVRSSLNDPQTSLNNSNGDCRGCCC